jgi:hypothetical protein
LDKPYLGSVVVSPHVYGPSITHNAVGYKGAMLWDGLDISFGYLNRKGYCHKGRCHKFPIAIGEFGSKFVNPEDLAHLKDFSAWLRNEVPGHKDTHNAINNWFYVSLLRHSSPLPAPFPLPARTAAGSSGVHIIMICTPGKPLCATQQHACFHCHVIHHCNPFRHDMAVTAVSTVR